MSELAPAPPVTPVGPEMAPLLALPPAPPSGGGEQPGVTPPPQDEAPKVFDLGSGEYQIKTGAEVRESQETGKEFGPQKPTHFQETGWGRSSQSAQEGPQREGRASSSAYSESFFSESLLGDASFIHRVGNLAVSAEIFGSKKVKMPGTTQAEAPRQTQEAPVPKDVADYARSRMSHDIKYNTDRIKPREFRDLRLRLSEALSLIGGEAGVQARKEFGQYPPSTRNANSIKEHLQILEKQKEWARKVQTRLYEIYGDPAESRAHVPPFASELRRDYLVHN